MSKNFSTYLSVIEAWKQKDIDKVLSYMTDDIVWHYLAAVQPPVHGHAGARKFMERFGSELGEVRWRVFHYAEDGDRLFVEGVDEFDTKAGARVATPYAGVLEFRGDKICGWRDYCDSGVAGAMRAGGAASSQVEELVGRPAVTS
jgi:limonene-1,2-epoxide hydrolase